MKSLKHLLSCVSACVLVAAMANSTSAAIETRAILKTFFETGDVPTQDQFSNLIDSFLNYNDDGMSITGIATSGSTTHAGRKFEDDSIDSAMTFAPVGGVGQPIPDLATEFGGHDGFLALQLEDALGGSHFGYFQLSMDSLAVTDPQAIHVDYFVFNDAPGESLSITAVPEPTTLSMLTIASTLLILRRRKVRIPA